MQRAAREFAQAELADHKYVMVLHDHQANPHVHLSVRAESRMEAPQSAQGGPAPLARDVRGEAARLRHRREATRQATRGVFRNYPDLWRKRAAEEGRERKPRPEMKPFTASRKSAARDWADIASALRGSTEPADLRLARNIERFVIGRTLDREVPKERITSAPERGETSARVDEPNGRIGQASDTHRDWPSKSSFVFALLRSRSRQRGPAGHRDRHLRPRQPCVDFFVFFAPTEAETARCGGLRSAFVGAAADLRGEAPRLALSASIRSRTWPPPGTAA